MKKMMTRLMAAVVLLVFSPSVYASVVINTFSNGWYRNDGYTEVPVNSNIIVGTFPDNIGNAEFHNFFAFDLTSLVGQNVTSATLTIFAGNGHSDNKGMPVQYNNYSFAGDINALLTGTGGIAVYNALSGGGLYGQSIVPGFLGVQPPMPEVTVSLLPAAVVDINSVLLGADKRFVVGGACGNCGGQFRWIWGGSGGVPAASLTLETIPIPEPTTLAILGLGLAGLSVMRRRLPNPA